MSQKVKVGGTPGKAPLGYRNIGLLTPEGREERTVVVDSHRAELISWAFVAFATGNWTLRSLADELDVRGLTTRRTPKQPARPLRPNVLHDLLTNPYYKGDVVYQGVVHPGKHQPLTDPVTWQAVQNVLAAHAFGEKQRDHPHYLKSSVFCGDCESRFIMTNSKNRHGTIYPYFICIGRHQKRTTCTRKAMLVATVEALVEEFWAATVGLDPAQHHALTAAISDSLRAQRDAAKTERTHLLSTKAALMARCQKLVEAVYSGAIPTDLIASEQAHLGAQLVAVEQRLTATAATYDRLEANLTRVLALARDGHAGYLAGDPVHRRLLNQALFTHLYIDEHHVRASLAAPFDVLLAPVVLAALPSTGSSPETGLVTIADLLRQPLVPRDSKKAPAALRATGGLDDRARIPSGGFGGLKATALAALCDSLSNPSPPLLRALEILGKQHTTDKRQFKYNTTKHIIDQTGASDPAVVRLKIKENHKLSVFEIDQLVRANKAGTSQLTLAHQFHVHVETVNRHLRRRRQAPKLGDAAIRYHAVPRGHAA